MNFSPTPMESLSVKRLAAATQHCHRCFGACYLKRRVERFPGRCGMNEAEVFLVGFGDAV